MATTAGDVIDLAASLLNDVDQALFTDTKLLPFVKKAYSELGVELHNNGAPLLNEVSGVIDVPANSTDLGTDQPDDIVIPVRLRERASSDNVFQDMIEQYWEPDDEPGPNLIYWSWREEEIKFLGATQDRQVIIYYRKAPTAVDGRSSSIGYANAINFLSPRTAALAARFIGNNPKRGDELDIDAGINLEKLISRTVKGTQSNTARRKSYWRYLRNRQQGDNA